MPRVYISPAYQAWGGAAQLLCICRSWVLVWRANNGRCSSALLATENSWPSYHLLAGNSPAHPPLLRLLTPLESFPMLRTLFKETLLPLLGLCSVSTQALRLSDFPFHLKTSFSILFEKPLGNQPKGNLGVDWLKRCKEDTGEVLTESAELWDESLLRSALPSREATVMDGAGWWRQADKTYGPSSWAALQQKDFPMKTGKEKFLKYFAFWNIMQTLQWGSNDDPVVFPAVPPRSQSDSPLNLTSLCIFLKKRDISDTETIQSLELLNRNRKWEVLSRGGGPESKLVRHGTQDSRHNQGPNQGAALHISKVHGLGVRSPHLCY